MKKESSKNWVAWIALGLSGISILLWLCRYEPVTWTLFDTAVAFLSFIVGVMAVMLGYNILGLRGELKNEITKDLQGISVRHDLHTAHTMIYIETRLLHLAIIQQNVADIRQSLIMMLDSIDKTKKKEDVDYTINQIEVIWKEYGEKVFDDIFKEKLRFRIERLRYISDSALLLLSNHLKE